MSEPSLAALTKQVLTPDAQLESVLSQLAQKILGTRALVIADPSGLPVASVLRGPKTLTTTAMATLALNAAAKVTASLGLGAPDDILIDAGPWVIVVRGLGQGFTLCGVFPGGRQLHLARDAMTERSGEISELLETLR